MTKNKDIKTVVPTLRFPEFRDVEGWKSTKLGSIGTPSMCKRIFKEQTTDISIDNIPFYKIGTFGSIADAYIPPEIYEDYKSRYSFPNKGDILISASGTIGRLVVYNGEDAYFQDSNIVWINNNETMVLNNFLYYTYQTLKWQTSDGGVISRLYNTDLNNLNIKFPKSHKEQVKIADCLSSLEDLISTVLDKIEALKEYKKGMMQQLFPAEGKTVPALRFPEFQNDPDWQETKLIDISDKKVKWSFTGGPFGSNLKSSDYTDNGIRVIQLQNIGDGEFINNYKIYTSIDKANELLSCNIYKGDIIMSKMGDPVGRACIIPDIEDRYVMCSDGIRLVIDESKYNKYFIFSLINSNKYRDIIDKTSTGSTRKRIGIDDLKNIKLLLPLSRLEQRKIADCLSTIDILISAESNKLDQLKAHKKGLMQQLFPKA